MSAEDPEILDVAALSRKKLILSMIVPGMFVFFMWLVKISEILFETDLSFLGIYPLEMKGLPGIILSPFIHENFKHLFNNSLPLFFLATAIFYFYSDFAIKICLWIWLLTGLFVWIGGREAFHIGASGLVYGLASFLFFSGIIRRYYRLIALSLLIVFVYGSMVWGMLPDLYKNVSWESHMLGFVSGIITAVWFREEGPQEPVAEWLDDGEDDEDENEEDYMRSDNETKSLRETGEGEEAKEKSDNGK